MEGTINTLDRLKNFFTKNIFWKLFSIIAAIVLWFVVINLENPIETRTYAVNLTLLNVEELNNLDLALTNQANLESTWISVKVRGTRMALDKLHLRKENIQAFIDFKVLHGYTGASSVSVPVDIKLPYVGESLEAISLDPPYANVHTERISTIQKQITVVVSGTVADGYVALLPETTPGFIDIRGPLSLLNKIESVRVYIDITDANKDVEFTTEPKIYDEDENELLNLSKSVENAYIKVPVNKHSRVPVSITSQGLPAEGYTLDKITVEPKYVEIVGNDEDIKAIKEIKLIPVNIQGLTENYTTKQDLRTSLPANVSIKNGTPNEVTINVVIKKIITKEFTILHEDVNYIGTLPDIQYTILSDPIIVNLNGTSDIIDKITEKDIIGTIDVTDLEEGTHDIILDLSIPAGATLVGDPPKISLEIKEHLLEDEILSESTENTEPLE